MYNLEEAGLTKNESIIYQTLLDLGPSLAGQIARKSGLHRRTVYDVAETLIQKGLVGYILKNNRRIFKAQNPKRLREILEEKQKSLSPTIESLSQKYSSNKKREQTLFFKGKQALKTVFEDQLNYPEILILGANSDASKILPFYFIGMTKKGPRKKSLQD